MRPETEVGARCSKSEVVVRAAGYIEAIGIIESLLVAIRGALEQKHFVTGV